MAGFLKLTTEQRSQFVSLANDYINGDQNDRTELRQKFANRMNVGPLRDSCPCCGR
jgi:hypothetical protein